MSLLPMEKPAELVIDDRRHQLPVLQDNTGQRSLDIRNLLKDTGLTVYDPGFANTAVCESAVTFVDGDKGLLSHRGYAIEDLCEHCSFIEVAYLLLHGVLPSREQREKFSSLLNRHSMLHEDMCTFFRGYPEGAHPMVVLSAMVVSLSSFYPEIERGPDKEGLDMTATRLLSKLRTIAAFSYKKSVGEPFVYPSYKLSYCENFLNMMFSSPVVDYKAEPYLVKAMNQLLIIHADHEQNASTATVRQVGSTRANLYAAISAGICALWGPLHGGANQAVIEMLQMIQREGLSVNQVVEKAKDKKDPFRLMGFGHRIYKSYDPRAKIAKKICRTILEKKKISDPLLDIALGLEEKALSDPYFQERKLYPNVDFYTGIIYRAMGFPTAMYTVLFALGRLPGWIAHWLELTQDPSTRIYRPRQLYTGPLNREFLSLEKRR